MTPDIQVEKFQKNRGNIKEGKWLDDTTGKGSQNPDLGQPGKTRPRRIPQHNRPRLSVGWQYRPSGYRAILGCSPPTGHVPEGYQPTPVRMAPVACPPIPRSEVRGPPADKTPKQAASTKPIPRPPPVPRCGFNGPLATKNAPLIPFVTRSPGTRPKDAASAKDADGEGRN
jgi:hypothetical protein